LAQIGIAVCDTANPNEETVTLTTTLSAEEKGQRTPRATTAFADAMQSRPHDP